MNYQEASELLRTSRNHTKKKLERNTYLELRDGYGFTTIAVRYHNGGFIRVGPNATSILHEEHKPVTLAPGVYEVKRAREFDYLTDLVRTVAD